MVKIVRAYVRIVVAQIRKLTVSLKNGSDEVGLSTPLPSALGHLLVISPQCSIRCIWQVSWVFRVDSCTVGTGDIGDASWHGAAGLLVMDFGHFELGW